MQNDIYPAVFVVAAPSLRHGGQAVSSRALFLLPVLDTRVGPSPSPTEQITFRILLTSSIQLTSIARASVLL